MKPPSCDLVLPCRDEAAALRALLPQIPAQYRVIVVDNASTDDTAEVAGESGAEVVYCAQPGYGAAVHAGLEASTAELVAVMDGDGSFDPEDLAQLVQAVGQGQADIATGRRCPVARGVWPWHARIGNRLVVGMLRRRGLPVHDIAPMRVTRRTDLLDLDVKDRRFGYPFELMQRAVAAQWRFAEFDVAYHPRAAGTRSKVSGSVRGTLRTARDLVRVLA